MVTNHVGMRLRRYSISASVPLATIAALGVRKGFPSRLRHLRNNTKFNSFCEEFIVHLTGIYSVSKLGCDFK